MTNSNLHQPSSPISAAPASYREMVATQRALVSLADEMAALREELGLAPVPEPEAVKFARASQADGRTPEALDAFAAKLRAQARPRGPQGPPLDAHADTRAQREASYARAFPAGADGPSGRRRRLLGKGGR